LLLMWLNERVVKCRESSLSMCLHLFTAGRSTVTSSPSACRSVSIAQMFSMVSCPWEYTDTVFSDVKYSVQKLNIKLERNYSYMIPLYSVLHEGSGKESFIGSVLTAWCYV
jgi:hypothetical protein